MKPQARFDLAQFNAETTNLHLLVVTPQVLQVTVDTPAHQVAGAIHQTADERIGDKFLGAQFRLVEITLGDTGTCNIQLADRAHRHRLLTGIEHVGAAVADRTTDRNVAAIDRGDLESRREGRGFGRTIAIEQVLRCSVFEHPGNHRRVQHVATNDQIAQGAQTVHQAIGMLMEQAGSHPQYADRLLAQQRRQRLAGQQHLLFDHHHAAAIEQRRPDLQGAGIEGRVGGERHPVLFIEIGITVVEYQTRNRTMRHQHAFGSTSRTGGVHDVGQRLGRLEQARIMLGQTVLDEPVEFDPRHFLFIRLIAVGQQPRGPAVFEYEALALERRIDIQRHIDRRALADCQLADQQVRRTLQQDRQAIARLHTEVEQMMRQAVRPPVEFTIAEHLPAMHHRRAVRLGRGADFEQPVQGLLRRVGALGGIEAMQHLLSFRHRQN